jgi:hypothetical protein
MGGFVLEDAQKAALFPIVPHWWLEGQEFRDFDFPEVSEKEIQDRNKGDALAKAIIICQLLWYLAQGVARAVQRLEVTELELVTAAYAIITLVIYMVWWQKPVGISCYMRVSVRAADQVESAIRAYKPHTPLEPKAKWRLITSFASNDIPLEDSPRVPTLYAGPYLGSHSNLKRSQGNLVVESALGTVFGAVHCFAWNFVFASFVERWMWRVASIVTVAHPIMCCFFIFLWQRGDFIYLSDFGMKDQLIFWSTFGGTLLYIVARHFLLILPLIALRDLPEDAYRAVSWGGVIPHIG